MTIAAEPTAPSRRAQLKFVLVLGGLTAFGPLSIDMYLPALPRMAADLHAADSTVQLTLSAFIVGLALGQLVLGPLSDALAREPRLPTPRTRAPGCCCTARPGWSAGSSPPT
ncbi:hypothetical protein ABT262_29710, partial [Amycolatopsis mediterranei]